MAQAPDEIAVFEDHASEGGESIAPMPTSWVSATTPRLYDAPILWVRRPR